MKGSVPGRTVLPGCHRCSATHNRGGGGDSNGGGGIDNERVSTRWDSATRMSQVCCNTNQWWW